MMDTSLEWLLDANVKPANMRAYERLSEIDKMTMIVVGSEDSKPILEIASILERSIKKSRKIMINGTGHLPNLDKPNEFNKAVLDFLLKKAS